MVRLPVSTEKVWISVQDWVSSTGIVLLAPSLFIFGYDTTFAMTQLPYPWNEGINLILFAQFPQSSSYLYSALTSKGVVALQS